MLEGVDEVLKSCTYPTKQLTILTDLRRSGWDREAASVARRWDEPSALDGTPHRNVVGYKSDWRQDPMLAIDPALVTGRWRDLPINRSQDRLMGVLFVTQARPAMVIEDASHWAFSGTGLRNGDVLTEPGGVTFLGYEVDQMGAVLLGVGARRSHTDGLAHHLLELARRARALRPRGPHVLGRDGGDDRPVVGDGQLEVVVVVLDGGDDLRVVGDQLGPPVEDGRHGVTKPLAVTSGRSA